MIELANKIEKLKEITKNKNVAVLFPGQASQYKDMGMSWYNCFDKFKQTFDYINNKIEKEFKDYLGSNLFEIIKDEEKLNITLYSQISIFAVSISCYYTINETIENVVCFAGHSLGEYTALTASNTINLDDAINLVVKRGYYMHHYSQNGTMFAIIYPFSTESISKLENILQNYNAVIANYNSYNQLIVSSPINNTEQIKEEIKKEFNSCKIIPLKVSGAFHSYLVNQANNYLAQEIEKVEFQKPQKPIFLDTQPVTDPQQIKEIMKKQMITPVNWIKTVENINEKYSNLILLEVLPNKILTNLGRKGLNVGEISISIEEI